MWVGFCSSFSTYHYGIDDIQAKPACASVRSQRCREDTLRGSEPWSPLLPPQDTPPMPTYLLAWVVGSLSRTSQLCPTEFRDAPVNVSILATPGRCGCGALLLVMSSVLG